VRCRARADVREINDAIRERGLLPDNETEITALEQVDLTRAQKLDARHYPADCVLAFNRGVNGCRRGERGKLIDIAARGKSAVVVSQVRPASVGNAK
jgi:hypothetical protein